MRRISLAWRCLAPIVAPLLFAGSADAHGVGVEAKLVGDRLRIAAYFDDNSPAVGAKITVEDEARKPILDGRTDDDGVCLLPKPAGGRYRLLVDAGGGHRTRATLVIPGETATVDSEKLVTSGPNREEFTRFPWERILLGVLGIALAAGGAYAWKRRAAQNARRAAP